MPSSPTRLLRVISVGVSMLMGTAAAQVRTLPSPAGKNSAEPNLAVTGDGRVILSWVEPLAEHGHALWFATRTEDAWSEPREVARGDKWFVNWADFPSVMALPDGSLASHWLVMSGSGTYDYDVAITRSTDAAA